MYRPVEVTARPQFKLFVRYADGVEGEIELGHLAGQGVFAIWMQPGVFEQVSIGRSGEIKWNDAVDICPDAVYLQLTGKSPQDVFPALSEVERNA
jgi:hypothetical protein